MRKITTRDAAHGLGAAAALAAGLTALAPSLAAQEKMSIQDRKFVYAPWTPQDIGKLRAQYGLIGPGPQRPLPRPVFPGNLTRPDNVEALMPNARATVRQTGGRSPLGLAEPGDVILIVASYDAEPMVRDALRRAFKERGVEARILFEDELTGVSKEVLKAIDDAENVFDATDSQQEFRNWFFRAIHNLEKAYAWFKGQDAELFGVMFPDIKYPKPEMAELSKRFEGMVRDKMIEYLDKHAEVKKVFWRTGGRTRTRTMLKHHGKKYVGNFTYNNFFDLMSEVPSFPGDVWRLIETKTIEPIGYADRVEMSDPEGSVLAWDMDESLAQAWAKGVYQQGHLYMFPTQATGRWPYSLVAYPAYESEYVHPVVVPTANGVIATTNDHVSTHPRMALEIKNGYLADIKGGGYYGELMKVAQSYPGIHEERFPEFKEKGYWWLYEAGTGTNPKYFKHPAELLAGRNSSERNAGGVIHWSFGAYAQHGPEKIGETSPARIEFGKQTNLPIDHCCHNHTLMPTYQLRIRGLDQWVTLIEHGRFAAYDDRYVRALASRYGNPDQILKRAWVPEIPGITVPGDYNEYARNPGDWWIKWSHSIVEKTNKFLD